MGLGLPVDFAASSLGAYDGVVNVVGNLNPAISGFPKPLSTRWPKRVLPQQPQVNETNAQEIWVRAGQPVYVLRRVHPGRSAMWRRVNICRSESLVGALLRNRRGICLFRDRCGFVKVHPSTVPQRSVNGDHR